MSIIIGADIVPSASNKNFFVNGDIASLVGDGLINVLKDSDLRVFNLETPLTDVVAPIKKNGPTLRADSATVNGIKKIGVDLVTLANNHIMDQGVLGLESTITLLDENKIDHLGAGRNLKEALKANVIQVKGRKIGFYACAEHEFSIAEECFPGANPFDFLESFDHIADLRRNCDFLIVLYHGGKEHYQYPSPMLQRVCRKFVEKGAGLVVCQHSHCIGCEEKYKHGTIIYGQGNFIFDSNQGPFSNTSLLIKLNDDFSIDYLPLVKVEKGVRLAKDEIAQDILRAFEIRSEQIKENGFVERAYENFAKKMRNDYLLACSGYKHKFFHRVLNKLSGNRLSNFFAKAYKDKELFAIRNFIECEAHRELFIEGLKKIE